ncbi:MAG TPA: HAD hydrolase family protein, partial [Acidimicrobiales bacterium]|nr:HAD hydrolase family protein [Acidimicrobiales bacterium]
PQLFPAVFGVVDGICYRRFIPSDQRLDGPVHVPSDIGRQIAGHLATRRAVLPAAADRSIHLAGRQPAWEIAARIVSRAFGRYAMAFRPTVVDPLLRRMLESPEPSITDGSPSRSAWFSGDPGSAVAIKVDFAEGPFGHFDLASYDALSDLAAAAVSFDAPDVTSSLRSEYTRLTGNAIDPTRWMLYQLVAIWDNERRGQRSSHATRRASARVLQAFFTEVYLQGLPAATGRLVALDLDGCLESSTFGFPATTRAGAMALRALRAHGYRVLLASGRCRDEVAERCRTYGLAGGVAEYGAYVVPPLPHQPVSLLRPESSGRLETLRDEVSRRGGLEVDPDFAGVVRIRAIDRSRRSTGIGVPAAIDIVQAAEVSEASIRVIDGEDQTDLSPTEVDKGLALRFLLDHYYESVGQPLACAVGDSESDRSMFAIAERAYAPGNATLGPSVEGIRVARERYQLGCVAAASDLIGHAVGSCPTCAAPPMSSATEAVITLLSLQEGGSLHALSTIAKLCRSAARSAER